MIRKILKWSVSLLSLQAENLALRQQLGIYKRKKAKPKLKLTDRLFWMIFSKIVPGWQRSLYIVQPDTVVGWHRQGFTMFWSYISKPKRKSGRPRASKELRDLIKKMALDNSWGAPRIHGELKKPSILCASTPDIITRIELI